jgi:hypothetical protein
MTHKNCFELKVRKLREIRGLGLSWLGEARQISILKAKPGK